MKLLVIIERCFIHTEKCVCVCVGNLDYITSQKNIIIKVGHIWMSMIADAFLFFKGITWLHFLTAHHLTVREPHTSHEKMFKRDRFPLIILHFNDDLSISVAPTSVCLSERIPSKIVLGREEPLTNQIAPCVSSGTKRTVSRGRLLSDLRHP